jgi:hypothetical protein
VNSVVMVEKLDSKKLRICLDPRPLNEAIQREHYTMPTIEPGIDLTFSEVVSRNDDKGLADKVKLVNESLDKLCTQKNWGFISHKNIKAIHLNGSGLHLNRQGSAILAKNIKTHLLVNN